MYMMGYKAVAWQGAVKLFHRGGGELRLIARVVLRLKDGRCGEELLFVTCL